MFNPRIGTSIKKKSLRRSYRRLFKKNRTRFTRYSILAGNVAMLAAVIFFVTNNPDSNTLSRQTAVAGATELAESNPLDQLSSADIAVHAARMTNLPESVAITNQADSEATQLAITATENKVVAKPQIVSTSLKSAKDIQTYTTLTGDTLSSLATKFGVTSDSIRWSNSLTSERIDPGKALVIPPVSGIVYSVTSGDTADTLAARYAATKDQILADNDAEVAGLRVGQRILIRGGIQPVVVRAAAAGTTNTGYAASGFAFGARAIYGYNGYDYGYCTWYVANKRAAIGRAVPANLGNANTWDDRAPQGYNQTPAYGAAVVTGQRAPGHVAFVEEVYPDGSVRVSEMNTRGWGVRSERTYDANGASKFNYIH